MILFVSHDASRTGAPIALLHILKWLKENTSLEFQILLSGGGELIGEFQSIAKTHFAKKRRILNKIRRNLPLPSRTYYRIPRSIDLCSFTAIYSNTITNGDLLSKLKRKSVRVITHVHEMESCIQRHGDENWKQVLNHSDQFIAVSEAVRKVLVSRGINQNLISLVPECAYPVSEYSSSSRNDIRNNLGIGMDAFVVCGGGADVWRKGRDLFVQLAVGLSREIVNRDFHFVWLGGEPDIESRIWLEIDANHAGCSDKIHWVGSVDNPQEFLSASDVFAMTSREDPMPLIAIEAGMHGLPIVCFQAAGGTSEWVQNRCGFSVPYLDVASMVQAIKSLCMDSALHRSKSSKSRKIASDTFTVDKVASKIYSIINNQTSSY